MADLTSSQSADFIKITGGDELHVADVVSEDGTKKLWVKATSAPQIIGNLYEEYVKNGTNTNMNVNGSVTNVEFVINAISGFDLVVSSMAFLALDTGIKVQNFLGLNTALTNGLLIEVRSEGEVFQFQPIKNTAEFDIHFAVGAGGNFQIITASSGDYLSSKFGPSAPFVVKKQGTYPTNDYIKVIVRDNLTSIDQLKMLVFGQKDI